MWIDVNVKVGHWPFKKVKYNTCDAVLSRMNKFGVGISVVSNMNGIFYKNVQSANEELHQEINEIPKLGGRLIPFAVINPSYAGWERDLMICHEQYNMKGVMVYPKYHDYPVDDPQFMEFLHVAGERDMAVCLTMRMVDFRQRSWMDIKEEWSLADIMPILSAASATRFMLLNVAGSTALSPEAHEQFNDAQVLMDTSGRSLNDLTEQVGFFGADKFAFGSHAPFLDYVTGRLRVESVDVEVDREKIKHKNIRNFLKIE